MHVPEGVPEQHHEVFRILRHLFDRFAADNEVPSNMRARVSVYSFLRWVVEESPDAYEIAASVNDVTPEAVSEVKEVLHRPDAMGHLSGLWPYLIFDGRNSREKLKALNVVTLMQYEDGTVVPLAAYAHRDVTRGPLDDSAVMSVMSTYPPQLAQQLTVKSLDDFHAQYAGSNRGLCDRLVFDALDEAVNSSNADGSTRARMANLLSFMKQLLPPEVPAPVKELYGKPPVSEDGTSVGGWNW